MSIDKIKYRRILPASYLADMKQLEESDPEVYVRLTLYMEVYVRWTFQYAEKSYSIYSSRM